MSFFLFIHLNSLIIAINTPFFMLNMIIYLHHQVYSDKQGNISDLF
ncbi:unknown [Bacteroides sp. CAG:530]|nr:unknown [Bacteroides sp. CAG:530]